MKLIPAVSLCAALAFAVLHPAAAGVFPATGTPQNYTLPDGTSTFTDNSAVYGIVNGFFNSTIIAVKNNALLLTTATPPEGTISTNARLLLPVLDASRVVSAFTATFDLTIAAPTSDPNLIGEGFSFNLGAIPGNAGNGETGFAMANGLTIGWDLKDNGGEVRAIEIYTNGSRIGDFPQSSFPGAFIIDNSSTGTPTPRPVTITWDAQGLDLSWNGIPICQNLATPGFIPGASNRFAFSGRTSNTGLSDVSIDNLLVTTTAPDPLFTNGPVIWEFLARNNSNIEDDDGDHPDWIEIFNGQPTSQSLSGWFLTNDPATPKKWPFPTITLAANAYTYVFASAKNRTNAAHAHTSFTLAGEGGYLALVRPDGSIKSEITYGPQVDDIPSGFLSALDPLSYLSSPTPGRANTVIPGTTTPITRGSSVVIEEPVFTSTTGTPIASGFITANTSVVIAPPTTPGAQIRYTTNGTNPTTASTLYTAPIAVTNRSLAIRAAIFVSGAIPGPPKTLSLVFRAADLSNYRNSGKPFESSLPVLMLDSFGVAVDATTDPNGPRPHRFTWGMLFDPASSTSGKASLADTPAISNAAGTHVRGQSSSGFPQRPYALEWWKSDDSDKDLPMLGMPADSDWVLYSPYNEETLMRNAVVYTSMFQWAGQGAGMRSRLVEVFFNQGADSMTYADYRGIYLLVEKIKRSSSRVDVEKINEEVTDPALIPGGYVWKKDKPPQVYTINTSTSGGWGAQTYEVIDPNIPSTSQRTWLQNYVQSFESALYAANWQDPALGWRRFADPASFADNLLWVEAFKQIDGYRISTYFHKTRAGKITARPAWDYNLAGGNANYLGGENPAGWYYTHLSGGNLPYWPRLLQDPGYVREQWDRYWAARRSALSTPNINSLIDTFSAQIRGNDPREVRNTSRPASPPVGGQDFDTPASRHFFKNQPLARYDWPNANNWASRLSFQSEVEFFREWMRQRLEWMEFLSMDGSAGLVRMRPPNFHDHLTRTQSYKANVPTGWRLTMADQDGLANSLVLYTIDGPDPRTATGTTDPAATQLATTTTMNTLIANGQPWRYSASLTAYPAAQGLNTWTAPAFDDSTWPSGNSPIGYGDTGMATTLTANVPTSGANQVTCFRKTFPVANPAAVYELIMELVADDGAVVWINGQEALRCNMPYAPVAINFASRSNGVLDGIADGEAENTFVPYKLPSSLLVQGTNTIAIEVHQFQYGSSGNPNATAINDMRFDLRLKASSVSWATTPITLNNPGVRTVRARTRSGSSWSPLSIAEFTVGTVPASSSNLVISEIMYNPAPPSAAETAVLGPIGANRFEFIELLNTGNTPVDLSGLAITDAIQINFSIIPAASRILLPGARGLLVENRTAFNVRYPGRTTQILAEWTSGNLRNDGEILTLTANDGASTLRSLAWQPVSPWPPLAGLQREPGGPDFSLVLNSPTSNPDHSLPQNWRSSGTSRGNPGGTDSSPPPPDAITDSDNNGYSDFTEWAMGPGAVPNASTEIVTPPGGSPGTYLLFRIPRNGSADGVTLAAQASSNLASWSSDGLVDLGLTTDGTREYRIFRSAQPIGSLSRFYVRALISRP
jgi:hypothetical protein